MNQEERTLIRAALDVWRDTRAIIVAGRGALDTLDGDQTNAVLAEFDRGYSAFNKLQAALAQPATDLQLAANLLDEYGLQALDIVAAFKKQILKEAADRLAGNGDTQTAVEIHTVARTAQAASTSTKPMTDEQDRALCEAFCNSDASEYFEARPQLDSDVNRRIFYAGHRKAWAEYAAAHTLVEIR